MDWPQTLLVTLLTLAILIVVHEFGHFWVARRCGVKVLRFSVGFGPVIAEWRDRRQTAFALSLIPFGGYVKMLDERVESVPAAERDQAFNRQSVWRRMAIVAAGPAINLLFAAILYAGLFMVGDTQPRPIIGQVQSNSLAAHAGLPAQREIVAVDGVTTRSWSEVGLRLIARAGESGVITLRIKLPPPITNPTCTPEVAMTAISAASRRTMARL